MCSDDRAWLDTGSAAGYAGDGASRFNRCVHHHGHDHGERLQADRRRLGIALALILAFMVVEVVGGIVANSLSLLADAGHMLTDAASLTLALGAAWLAATPATPQRSFGPCRSARIPIGRPTSSSTWRIRSWRRAMSAWVP